MNKIVVVVPHSHTWLWSQVCLACLHSNPPRADGCEVEIVVVDNSPWSPAVRGITDTELGRGITVTPNHKSNKFHASALDCVVEDFEFDYLVALETDVMVLHPNWLQWFMDQLFLTDYAVGMWHHEQFLNPSCTLYRGDILRGMLEWCRTEAPQDELRWGQDFRDTAPLDNNLPLAENPAAVLENMRGWIGGPFAEKRGWPAGTRLREPPSGQLKGPGWYEPGQQLHHWAVQRGYSYTVCPTLTTKRNDGLPLQTVYGGWGEPEQTQHYPDASRMGCGIGWGDQRRQLEARELLGNMAYAAHLWGGTRALDILKHPVTCEFVKANTPGWLAREARFWRQTVSPAVQHQTIELIREHGWHYKGAGTPDVTDRDREAVAFVRECYEAGGVTF